MYRTRQSTTFGLKEHSAFRGVAAGEEWRVDAVDDVASGYWQGGLLFEVEHSAM